MSDGRTDGGPLNLDARSASILLGVGVAAATLLDFLYWSEAKTEVAFLREAHVGDVVALVAAAGVAWFLSKLSSARFVLIGPAVLYLVVEAWHAAAVTDVTRLSMVGMSDRVLALPDNEATSATLSHLQVAHIVVSALSSALALVFVGLVWRRQPRLRDVLGSKAREDANASGT